MKLSIPKAYWGNELPDKSEIWSNKCLTQEKYQVLLPSGSLAMCEMWNKAHQPRCPRIQAEQCRMDNPCLAQMESEQSGITHIYLQFHHSCSLHFQHSPVLLQHPLQPVLDFPGCEQYSISMWVVLRGFCPRRGSGQPSSVPCHSGHCLIAAAFARSVKGLEPAKAFCRSALIALNPESLKNLYKQIWFFLFT